MIAVLALCACTAEPDSPPKTTTAALSTQTLANLAGVDGTITTLAYYDGGGVHPGVNAIDVGAPGGTPVFHALDYLTPDIAGGWVFVAQAHEAGLCSQWWPGSPYYNGGKLYVYTYFYDAAGGFLGSHRAAFQHVDPYAPNVGAWWTWNNANAAVPAWPGGAALSYGGGAGLYLGDVHPVWSAITNGPGGALCTTGSHLHQEADGWRAPQRWVGEHVTGGYSDLHYFTPSGAMPLGAPPAVPGAPPPGGCGDLDYAGRCDGSVLVWCQDDEVQAYDCASAGLGCGWQNDAVGNNCL